MIPGPLRMKGGADQIGGTAVGRRGPFGVCEEEEPDDLRQAPDTTSAHQREAERAQPERSGDRRSAIEGT